MADEPFEHFYDDDSWENEHEPAIERLTRDMAQAARTMGPKEVRFLVDAYYTSQENRKRLANQARGLAAGIEIKEGETVPEPHALIDWLFRQNKMLEAQIKRALDQYTQAHVMGEWMRQIVGIGPVISAGVLAHLETPRDTAGKIYQFAGIAGANQKVWKKGEIRPYNAQLKTLSWHAGQCFMRLSNREDCFYGQHYRKRKAFEQMMSDTGQRAETAAEWLPRVGPTTQAHGHYKAGRLPPSQIDGRARRYAVKLFLSHMNETWLRKLGREPPKPFALGILGHVDYIPPPIPA